MKHVFTIFAALSVLFAGDVLAAGKPVVKIGVTAPLTGDNAHIGEGMRDAMALAKGKLPADARFDYEIVFEDDAMEAKKTAGATNKLISTDKVDAIVSVTSGTGGVVSPIAEQHKVFHFGLASAQSVADGTYNFINWTPPAEEARAMAAELQKHGIKTVATLFLNQQGSLAIREELNKNLAGTDIKVVNDQIINPGEKDFRTAIAQAKATNPDIYVVFFLSPELEIFMKQMREAGVGKNITSIEAFGVSTEPTLYEGLWYIDAAEARDEFYNDFKGKYSKEPAFGASNAYDTFNLIVHGFETANAPAGLKPSNESVVQALHKVKDFDGVQGKLSIDEKGVVLSPAAVKTIKDGKPVLASRVQAEPTAVEPASAKE